MTNDWVVVVAQLSERLLPIPEVCCLNLVITNILTVYPVTTKIKKIDAGNGTFKEITEDLSSNRVYLVL